MRMTGRDQLRRPPHSTTSCGWRDCGLVLRSSRSDLAPGKPLDRSPNAGSRSWRWRSTSGWLPGPPRTLSDLPGVTVLAVSFEQWEPGGSRFDMVFACNSFHWVDPDVRFTKAAALVEPAGVLVLMSTPVVVPVGASRFWWDVQDDWEAVGAERLDPAAKHPDLVDDLVESVRTCGLFEEPITRRYPFQVVVNASDYVANLSTQSGVKQLPLPAQAELLERIRRRIESLGNQLTVHHLAVITVARHRYGVMW